MVRLVGISLYVSLAVYACVAGTRTEEPLKLYVLDGGMLWFESVEAFGIGDDETDVRDLAVPCYVIAHESGRMLWDGGLPSNVAETPGWQGEGGMRMRLDRTLAEQLADMDLDMSSFDYVAFSHMHFDHVGVANELQGATLIIQKPEFEAAFADELTVPGLDATLYAGLRDAERRFCSSTSPRPDRSCCPATCITSDSAARTSGCRPSTSTSRRPASRWSASRGFLPIPALSCGSRTS
jgi:hypothetical protein